MWISQKNEDSKGSGDHQPEKKTGAEKTYHRVGFGFPKALRILSRKHYQQVFARGIRFSSNLLFFQYYKTTPPSRLGITVSRKYGKAHDRNRFKRLVREVFREVYEHIPTGIQINVSPRLPRTAIEKDRVLADFLSFFSNLPKE